LGIELKLKLLLGSLHQEEPNGLGDGIPHIPHNQLKVGINSCPDFLNKQVVALLSLESLLDYIALLLRSVGVFLLWSWDNVSSIGKIISVIGEEVVLFSINDGLYHLSALLSFFLKHLNDHIHDFSYHRRESDEDPVHYALSNLLKNVVDILKKVQCRLSQLFQLGLDKVHKDIH